MPAIGAVLLQIFSGFWICHLFDLSLIGWFVIEFLLGAIFAMQVRKQVVDCEKRSRKVTRDLKRAPFCCKSSQDADDLFCLIWMSSVDLLSNILMAQHFGNELASMLFAVLQTNSLCYSQSDRVRFCCKSSQDAGYVVCFAWMSSVDLLFDYYLFLLMSTARPERETGCHLRKAPTTSDSHIRLPSHFVANLLRS